MVNTFGPIDWKEYYSGAANVRRIKAKLVRIDVAERSPCQKCSLSKRDSCGHGLTPQGTHTCKLWHQYFKWAWPLVTGQRLVVDHRMILEDLQDKAPVAYCAKCGGEIYAEEAVMPGDLCMECWEESDESV